MVFSFNVHIKRKYCCTQRVTGVSLVGGCMVINEYWEQENGSGGAHSRVLVTRAVH